MCVSWGIQKCMCSSVENAKMYVFKWKMQKCMCSSRKSRKFKMYGAEVEKADVQVGTLPASTTLRFAGSHLRLLYNGLLKSLVLLYTTYVQVEKASMSPKRIMHVGSLLIGLYKTFAPAFHTRLTDICLVPMFLLCSHAPMPLCDDEHLKCCHLRWR